jgi:hypothetical protein
MKIGLIDVDGHNFPNLALMKISAYHKSKGDSVEWAIPMLKYDIVYQSKVFDFSPDENTCIRCEQLIKGGTGYDLDNKLPQEIESIYPDYSLYNEKKAYGFLTRGCPRNCPFCIVGKKEGLKSVQVADLRQFWNGQKEIKLCDPNITACPDRIKLLQQLVDSKAWVDFTQGLDIRFMTDDVIDKIKQIRVKMLHFAWDREKDSDIIIRNLIAFKKATNIDMRKARVYVLTNYETDFDFDLYRVYKLREMGYDPYIMIYDKQKFVNEKTNRMYPMHQLLKQFTLDQIKHFKKVWKLQRWVDNKFIFRTCEKFEDYK